MKFGYGRNRGKLLMVKKRKKVYKNLLFNLPFKLSIATIVILNLIQVSKQVKYYYHLF